METKETSIQKIYKVFKKLISSKFNGKIFEVILPWWCVLVSLPVIWQIKVGGGPFQILLLDELCCTNMTTRNERRKSKYTVMCKTLNNICKYCEVQNWIFIFIYLLIFFFLIRGLWVFDSGKILWFGDVDSGIGKFFDSGIVDSGIRHLLYLRTLLKIPKIWLRIL